MSKSETTDDYVAMPEEHYRSLARRAEAGEAVALHAEEFLDRLEKRWPEVTDMDDLRDALLKAISPEYTREKMREARRHNYNAGAEAMRRVCIAVSQPLGNYSNTPEMQERLKVRCEITQAIESIDVESLTDGK